MKKLLIICSTLFSVLPAIGVCDGTGHANQAPFSSLKNVGEFVVGSTKLAKVKNDFGGAIKSNESTDGRFNSLCLLSTYKGKKVSINLISGALGGWETVTEYEISTLKENSNRTVCGHYNFDSSKNLLLFQKPEEIAKLFGRPKKSGGNSAEYTSTYDKDKSGSGYVIYTGLTVFYGDDQTVEKYDYFETESN